MAEIFKDAMRQASGVLGRVASFPDWLSAPPSGRLVQVVAVGEASRALTIRRFLRIWSEAGIGGEVIVSVTLDAKAVRERCEDEVLRFLERRPRIVQLHGSDGRIGIWPIASDFRPRFCARCWLPIGAGACPKCVAEGHHRG